MTASPNSPPTIHWGVTAEAPTLTEERAAEGILGGFRAVTDLAACVLPLLQALRFEGDLVHVAEALPHFAEKIDLTALLNVMANLGYSSTSMRLRPTHLDPRLMPCLYLPEKGMALVLMRRDGDKVLAFDAGARAFVTVALPTASGRIYLFKHLDEEQQLEFESTSTNFVGALCRRFRPIFLRLLLASFASNVLVLATPLFIMAIYDQFLPTGATSILYSLLAGAAIAILGDVAIRAIRARMIAYTGARLDHLLGLAIFRRLLLLAPPYTEQANANAQVARLRDFETVREFFTGPLATTLVEFPFIALFLVVMAIIGGLLVAIPIGALVLYLIVAYFTHSIVEQKTAASTRAQARRQEFLVEAFSKPRAIRESGADLVWLERFRELSAESALESHKSTRAMTVVSSLSQSITVIAGLLTLAWGVERVLANEMTVGALMASMMMVWWVLRPLQLTFSLASQIERVRASVAQINRLMQVRPERVSLPTAQSLPNLVGKINFSNVSLRYSAESDPALLGVSFQADKGEIVALVGPNGSGKSTVCKLVLGLYRPQTGAVQLDDIDIRQFDPIELRRRIAYVPQQPAIFFGTIAQNLRLVFPTASEEELRWACEQAGVLDEILALPDGLETRLGDGRNDRISSSLRQRLSLARAYLKRAPITIFDEPALGLDFMADRQFMLTLEKMRGHSTILLVTHRPSHLKLADKIVVMVQGQVRMLGPAKQVLERMPPEFF